MTDTKKFMFDTNDFNKTKPSVEDKIYTEAQMVLAKEQSFSLGKTAGMSDSKENQEAHLANLVQKTSALCETLIRDEDRREMEKCIDATKLAMKVMHKLLPKFTSLYALQEIEHVILQSIETRKDEPRLAVTVPTQHLDALKTRMDAIAIEKGYGGKVILIADDGLAATDCRVEWSDGGAERLYERLFLQIENEFTKTITGIQTNIEQDKT